MKLGLSYLRSRDCQAVANQTSLEKCVFPDCLLSGCWQSFGETAHNEVRYTVHHTLRAVDLITRFLRLSTICIGDE